MMMDVDVDAIVPWEGQPRKHFDEGAHRELRRSVAERGVIQPLVLRVTGEEGVYQLVCGERRWRAAKAAGVGCVPAVVRELDDKDAMELAMMENLRRQDLDVLEEAEGFHALLELGFSVKEMAERFGKGRDFINGRLELRRLDGETREALLDRRVTIQTAVALGRLEEGQRGEALRRVVHPDFQEEPLSQRQALDMIRREYVRPNEARREWEARAGGLGREWPGARVAGYEEGMELAAAGSGYVGVDERPAVFEVAGEWREDMENVPTWGELAGRYGAQEVVCPPKRPGGDVRVVVEKQPLVDADVVQAPVGRHLFPKPVGGRDAGVEQGVLKKAMEEKAAADARRRGQLKGLVEVLGGRMEELLGGDVRPAFRQYMEVLRRDYRCFQGVYNLLYDGDLNGWDGDDCAKLAEWVDGIVEEHGLGGFLWLLFAEQMVGGESVAGWMEVLGVDGKEYPDLVSEEGEGDD